MTDWLFPPDDDERPPACELRGRKLRRTGIGSHQAYRGRTETWLTPKPLLDALCPIKPFDLDPCCPHSMPWTTAERMYHHPQVDGLALDWVGRVWLNPPYGPELGKWLHKMATHAGGGTALIFARTETETFHRDVWPVATAMLFLRGRITFHDHHGKAGVYNAGGPSVLVAYGVEDGRILRDCGIPGAFVELKALR